MSLARRSQPPEFVGRPRAPRSRARPARRGEVPAVLPMVRNRRSGHIPDDRRQHALHAVDADGDQPVDVRGRLRALLLAPHRHPLADLHLRKNLRGPRGSGCQRARQRVGRRRKSTARSHGRASRVLGRDVRARRAVLGEGDRQEARQSDRRHLREARQRREGHRRGGSLSLADVSRRDARAHGRRRCAARRTRSRRSDS